MKSKEPVIDMLGKHSYQSPYLDLEERRHQALERSLEREKLELDQQREHYNKQMLVCCLLTVIVFVVSMILLMFFN